MSTTNSRRKCQRGFTVIELIVTLMIMGILAAIIVPRVTTFFGTGTLSAALGELENIRTAAVGYYGQHQYWPGDSSELGEFVSSSPKATYVFDTATGRVAGVTDVGWSGVSWSTDDGKWARQQ